MKSAAVFFKSQSHKYVRIKQSTCIQSDNSVNSVIHSIFTEPRTVTLNCGVDSMGPEECSFLTSTQIIYSSPCRLSTCQISDRTETESHGRRKNKTNCHWKESQDRHRRQKNYTNKINLNAFVLCFSASVPLFFFTPGFVAIMLKSLSRLWPWTQKRTEMSYLGDTVTADLPL